MTASRDPDRLIRAFVTEGVERLDDRVYDAVRADMDRKRQRAFVGPWRLPTMNKLVPIGVGAAAAVAAVALGAQLLSPPATNLGPGAGASPTPATTVAPTSIAAPSSNPDRSLALGPFVVFDPADQPPPFDDGPKVTVTIPSSGWTAMPQFGALLKGDQADPPQGAGAALLTGDTGADGLYVYGDPCHWESTTPETPASTVDAIVDALAAQASRDASAPVDVMVGGYAGKSITLRVPNTASTRAQAFKDCDQTTFATYGVVGHEGPARYQQGPGQVDVFWILDVDGVLVILDAAYGPATPAELVDEVRALAESATFD